MPLEVFKPAHEARLVRSARKTRQTFLSEYLSSHFFAQVLQSDVFARVLELSGVFNYLLGFGKQAKMLDALFCQRYVSKFAGMVHRSRQGLQASRPLTSHVILVL